MRRALTAEQTRALEERAMDALGITLGELMAHVGRACAEEAQEMAPAGRIVVLTGKGNNAGDGWVCAELLHTADRDVRVLALVQPDELPDVARAAATRAIDAGVTWATAPAAGELEREFAVAALVVDAVFGFGIEGAPREPFASAIESLAHVDVPVLSVDLPSGIESDTARAPGAAVRADRTLAVITLKTAHVKEPGASHAGEVRVATLGIDPALLDVPDTLEVWEDADVRAVVPMPEPLDHKGTRGRVLVVGGSAGMSGAVSLAAAAALRSGAGYVTVAVPDSLVDLVDAAVVPAVVRGLPEGADRAFGPEALGVLLELASASDSVLVGPGLGSGEAAREVARRFVEGCEAPLVIDADALNAIAEAVGGGEGPVAARAAATIVTPHPGEAARLLGESTAAIQDDRIGSAKRIAAWGAVAVLKGAGTIVCGGSRCGVVRRGAPSLATMGTGDVLAGMTAALLALGGDPFEAAYASAYLHGVAGEAAGHLLTDISTTAEDVLASIPDAVMAVLLGDV